MHLSKRSLLHRSACPRCSGSGFLHFSNKKDGLLRLHDTDLKPVRCRKCVDCPACEASGIVVDAIGCQKCSARGFFHPKHEGLKKHPHGESIKCEYCVDCKALECESLGILYPNKLKKELRLSLHNIPRLPTPPLNEDGYSNVVLKNTHDFPSTLDQVHPHMGALIQKLQMMVGPSTLADSIRDASQEFSLPPPTLFLFNQKKKMKSNSKETLVNEPVSRRPISFFKVFDSPMLESDETVLTGLKNEL